MHCLALERCHICQKMYKNLTVGTRLKTLDSRKAWKILKLKVSSYIMLSSSKSSSNWVHNPIHSPVHSPVKSPGFVPTQWTWAVSILWWMGFVQRRSSTQANVKLSDKQISELTYLSQIKGMVKAHNIPSELVINWDQSEVKAVPSHNLTMEQQWACQMEIVAINDKRPITVTLAGTFSGELLPIQILLSRENKLLSSKLHLSRCSTHQTIGQMRKLLYGSSKTSSFDMCKQFD